jgi:hypothetical protein
MKWISMTALVCLASCPCSATDDFLSGTAVVDITPPGGYRMSGYFMERLNTGVRDPLKAKALVFSQGKVRAALVFCDLIGIGPGLSRAARTKITAKTGIPLENIAIAATHSHTGPLYFGALREHFHKGAVASKGKDPHEDLDYSVWAAGKIAEAVIEAARTAAPVRIRHGVASEGRLSFNRRFHMKEGGVRFNPGQLNPAIVRTAGPIDPAVGIIEFLSAGGTPRASLAVFALHLDTVGGTEYSADYPRYLSDELRGAFGKEYTSFFGAGTCGDINHIDVTVKGRRSAGEIGKLLAGTVRGGIEKLAAVKRPSLAVRRAEVEVPLQRYSKEEIEKARRDMELVGSNKLPFLHRVKAYKIMALQLRKSETISLEVQAFRLSPELAIVTLPGEVFVELGLAIKKGSPFSNTLVVELVNDAPGYIPTRKAFTEGSYETVNSRVRTGGGEIMVETAIGLLRALKKDG